MTLQEILYGTWLPPESVKTRRHVCGLTGGSRYKTTINMRRIKTEGMNNAQLLMYERLQKQIRPVSAADMGKKLKITTNHAGILLGELFKLGKVKRIKTSGNGTRFFLYSTKDKI